MRGGEAAAAGGAGRGTKETVLSCQEEMKTELSVTEHRLHGSNSFRLTVQPLCVQRFPPSFRSYTSPTFDLAHVPRMRRARRKKLKDEDGINDTASETE